MIKKNVHLDVHFLKFILKDIYNNTVYMKSRDINLNYNVIYFVLTNDLTTRQSEYISDSMLLVHQGKW